MHSWVFRNRAHLLAIYDRSPVVEVEDCDARTPFEAGAEGRRGRDDGGPREPALAELELLPMPRRAG